MVTTDQVTAQPERLAELLLQIDSFDKHVAKEVVSRNPLRSRMTSLKFLIAIPIAASILALLIFAPQSKTTDAQISRLVEKHYSKFDDVLSTRSGPTDIDHLMIMYNNNDIEGFFRVFNKIQMPSEHQVFYASQMLLANGEYQNYMELTDRISNSHYSDVIPWYNLVWAVQSEISTEDTKEMVCNYQDRWYNSDKVKEVKAKICF